MKEELFTIGQGWSCLHYIYTYLDGSWWCMKVGHASRNTPIRSILGGGQTGLQNTPLLGSMVLFIHGMVYCSQGVDFSCTARVRLPIQAQWIGTSKRWRASSAIHTYVVIPTSAANEEQYMNTILSYYCSFWYICWWLPCMIIILPDEPFNYQRWGAKHGQITTIPMTHP